jgi:hypothetical protein
MPINRSENVKIMIMRDLAMIVLSFAGFLRFDELSFLKCNDVTVHDPVLKLKIGHNKNHQYMGPFYSINSIVNDIWRTLSVY